MRRAYTRRRLLAAAGGTVVGAGLTSTAGGREPAERGTAPPDFGGWLDGVDGGFKDATGQREVTVKVGAEGNGGTFAFSPAGLVVDPGTTVTFEWASDSHNIAIEDQPDGADWEGVSELRAAGFTHEHTFESRGLTKYYCQPHKALGMKGAVLVGDVSTGTQTASGAVEGPDLDWLAAAPNYGGRVVDRRGRDSTTVRVGAENRWGTEMMAPAAVWVDPGTEVRFRWVTGGYDLGVHSHPPTADWEGHEAVADAGFEHSHTFEVRGVYEYYGGNELHGAVLVGENPTEPGDPVGGAEVAWRHRVETEAAGDQGYQLVEAEDTIVAVGDRIFALDKSSGEVRWEREPEQAYLADVHGDPEHVDDGTVYVVPGDWSEVLALDVDTGDRRWRYRYEPVGDSWGLGVVPVDDGVYVLGDRTVVALADDGTERWTHQTESFAVDTWKVSDGVAYALTTAAEDDGNRRLLAIDPEGRERWRTEVPETDLRSVLGGTVLLFRRGYPDGPDGRLVGVDAESGRRRWRYADGDVLLWERADADRNQVYLRAATGSDAPRQSALHAVDVTDGSQAWRTDVGRTFPFVAGLADGTLYAVLYPPENEEQELLALDPHDGSQRWRTGFPKAAWTGPELVGDSVCFGTGDHEVIAFAPGSGDRRWSYDTGGSVRSLRTHGGALLGFNDNGLFAFDPGNGDVFWRVEFDHATEFRHLFVDENRVFPAGGGRVFGVNPGSTTRSPSGLLAKIPPVALGVGGAALVALGAGAAWRRVVSGRSTDDDGTDDDEESTTGPGSTAGESAEDTPTDRSGADAAAHTDERPVSDEDTVDANHGSSETATTDGEPATSLVPGGVPDEADGETHEALRRAERRLDDAESRWDAGRIDDALPALTDAVEECERALDRASAPAVTERLEQRLGELRARRSRLRERHRIYAELQETLADAERRLYDATEAYENDRPVVARNRYRQARDLFDSARSVAEHDDLDTFAVDVEEATFDSVEDVRNRIDYAESMLEDL